MAITLRAVPGCHSRSITGLALPATIGRALLSRGVLLEGRPGEAPSTCSERIDTALMALFRDTHDSECFETLYQRTSQAVVDWLRRLMGQRRSGIDPLEVLQDTFVNVYQYSTRFRDERPDSFRVWVRTIASNALRRARSQVPRRPDQHKLDARAEPTAPRSEPALRLDEEEEQRRLALTWVLFLDHYARAYAGLAARDQAALALVELERLSYAQAGERLAVGASNMKMIMFRARQRLIGRMNHSMGCARQETPRKAAPLRAVG